VTWVTARFLSLARLLQYYKCLDSSKFGKEDPIGSIATLMAERPRSPFMGRETSHRAYFKIARDIGLTVDQFLANR
jgi:hypothetical protein